MSFGTRSKNQPTLSMLLSSIGTRHSKWPPVKRQFGQREHRHTRARAQSPSARLTERSPFEGSHSKCTGSIEFSWHWNQLQGTSENTICTKPFFHVNGSQVGTSGAGGGPREAPRRPPLTRASGWAVSSSGC